MNHPIPQQAPLILLASSSPRRQELLQQVGLSFDIYACDIDESVRACELPADYVLRLAQDKASYAIAQHPQYTNGMLPVVIAADTSVTIDNVIFGKPTDLNDAIRMWQQLSGRTHQVMTGITVAQGQHRLSTVVTTAVTFATLSTEDMHNYWQTGEPIGKAGAYAIQGLGAAFITHIAGSYSNVVGLPLFETLQYLKQLQSSS